MSERESVHDRIREHERRVAKRCAEIAAKIGKLHRANFKGRGDREKWADPYEDGASDGAYEAQEAICSEFGLEAIDGR